MKKQLLALAILFTTGIAQAQDTGVPVAYQLPNTPGETYTVSLAVTDPKNPRWIVSTFLAGAPRTVTAENKGKFTEYWNGLDENFMPVLPGKYGVKGIYAVAKKWRVDGQYHAITPQFVTGASAFVPQPDPTSDKAEPDLPFGGDPVGSPIADVDVGPNGVAVFYYQYLENGTNNPMIDLTKPAGYGQFIRAFNSGGAGGGTSTATDGETVWSFSTDGGPKYVYRADRKPFGKSPGANRSDSYPVEGWVTGMAAYKDATLNQSFVYVAQRGVPFQLDPVKAPKRIRESENQFANKLTVHDGQTGKVLAELPTERPKALTLKNGNLYVLTPFNNTYSVSSVPIQAGLPQGNWRPVFNVPANIKPSDLEVDSQGRFYLSDPDANKVYQLDKTGKVTLTFGRLSVQKPGAYDPLTMMTPNKLATWKDPQGNDRLLVVEAAGPNRVSEWSTDGKFIRDFLSHQTKSNDGYTYDPDNPEMIYIMGQRNWLTRFKVDYAKNTWTVDAVWPNIGDDSDIPKFQKPQFIRLNGREYIAGGRSYNIYRHDGDRWVPSAALMRPKESKGPARFWNDANNNGEVDEEEIRLVEMPASFFLYHGQNWLEDLSLALVGRGTRDIYRIAPTSFDPHGNPVFTKLEKVLTDPVYEARATGKATALFGGNELDDYYLHDWTQVDGKVGESFYVQARGGRGATANFGAQQKLTRYNADGKGGYTIDWRVGRTANGSVAKPDEMYGGMRVHRPINGLVAVIDQTRCGILLYTEDGIYVDTIFADVKKVSGEAMGIYQQGGEFFAGSFFPNKNDGNIYLAMGKYTPMIYKTPEWTLKDNPVKTLTEVQKEVTISAAQISAPPELALSRRGGAGSAKFARFTPALGEIDMDGGMQGWEAVEPVTFGPDKTTNVEVRTLYRPDAILLRWHARLPAKFAAKPMPPLERIFTHDVGADTLSFYIQGDLAAKAAANKDGRPGDARFVFGLFNKDGQVQPAALGLYPEWKAAGAKPQTYRTPVGTVNFAHAGPVSGIKLGHSIDTDGKGFVLTASIPRAAVPALSQPLASGAKTQGNFEANFGGHNKFWWANSDGSANTETYDEPSEARLYPGSWAPFEFEGLEGGLVVKTWQVLGPFGGPVAESWNWNPNQPMKQEIAKHMGNTTYPVDDWKYDAKAEYTGDVVRGWWVKNKAPKVTWKTERIDDLDVRVSLFVAGSLAYATTWVHVPQDTELDFQFQGHQMSFYRWALNGEPITGLKYVPKPGVRYSQAIKKLTLKAGWNQIMVRGYCYAYAPLRVGLIFDGPLEKLSTLTVSAKQPAPQ